MNMLKALNSFNISHACSNAKSIKQNKSAVPKLKITLANQAKKQLKNEMTMNSISFSQSLWVGSLTQSNCLVMLRSCHPS
jgi:hypothetical protein